MSVNVTIKNREGINLDHLSNIAQEYYGEIVSKSKKGLEIKFNNIKYAQDYERIIGNYFLTIE